MSRPSVYDAARQHVDYLAAQGIRAVLTMADLVPPCVLIAPPAWSPVFSGSGADLEWTFHLVAGDTVRGPALAELSRLLDQMAGAYPGQFSRATPASVDAGGDIGTLPAYRLTITQRLITTEETP